MLSVFNHLLQHTWISRLDCTRQKTSIYSIVHLFLYLFFSVAYAYDSDPHMVSCNVGLTSALTSLYLFQMPRLGSDIQNLSTGIGLTPSPTRCNIRSDLTVSVIAFFIIFLICHIKYYKKNINISQGGFSVNLL